MLKHTAPLSLIRAGGSPLTRSMAEQGFGKPRPGDVRETTLPTIPGAPPSPSSGEGESSTGARGGGGEKVRGNLRGGRGGGHRARAGRSS